MKKSFIFISIFLMIAIMSSCSSTKVTVSGTPGLQICNSNRRCIAVIPESGSTTIDIGKDCVFLYTHEKDSVYYVPFAINYQKDMVGKYLPEQKTNSDLTLSPLVQTAEYKSPKLVSDDKSEHVVEKQDKQEAETKVADDENTESDNSEIIIATSEINEIVKEEESDVKNDDETIKEESNAKDNVLSSKDLISIIGIYSGKGRLIESGEVTDRYNNMTVTVLQHYDNVFKVTVNINGLAFFRKYVDYVLSKEDGVLKLKNKEFRSTITINNDGTINYERRNMNEYGSTGVLKITAKRE